jgi:hypothetical protein
MILNHRAAARRPSFKDLPGPADRNQINPLHGTHCQNLQHDPRQQL